MTRARLTFTAVVDFKLPDMPHHAYERARTPEEALAVDERSAKRAPLDFLAIMGDGVEWEVVAELLPEDS